MSVVSLTWRGERCGPRLPGIFVLFDSSTTAKVNETLLNDVGDRQKIKVMHFRPPEHALLTSTYSTYQGHFPIPLLAGSLVIWGGARGLFENLERHRAHLSIDGEADQLRSKS